MIGLTEFLDDLNDPFDEGDFWDDPCPECGQDICDCDCVDFDPWADDFRGGDL